MSKPADPANVPITPPHDDAWQQSSWRSGVRTQLLAWFAEHARDLPWRRDATPYRVWVSEIMLQQTQVATVIPFYERFLNSYPTVEKLASSDEQTLLGHWEGLGYYRRARSMHAAAKQLVDRHQGRFPESYEQVLALPGIGRYTAGAILSISRDMRLPILEGNTQRVFSRWVAIRGPATDSAATKLLWRIAAAMLPRAGAGTFNQAAMELGALVCTPKTPKCALCPVAKRCRARALGLQEQIPGKVSRVEYEDRCEFAMVIAAPQGQRGSAKYLVRPLPDGARWAGLWDFPRTTQTSLDSVEAAARELSKHLGVAIAPGMRIATIRHAVTKYRISLDVHTAQITGPTRKPPRPWRYVTLAEMEGLPMSASGRRIARLLASDRQTRLDL